MSDPKSPEIPSNFSNDERIIRGLFSMHNFRKDFSLKSNVFSLRPEVDAGVSVIRLNYSHLNFCKQQFKKIEKPIVDKHYYGMALLLVGGILSTSTAPVTVKMAYTPQNDIAAHAEIYYFINGLHYANHPQGVPMPTAISIVIDKLLKHARSYPDKDLNSETWTGEDLSLVRFP